MRLVADPIPAVRGLHQVALEDWDGIESEMAATLPTPDLAGSVQKRRAEFLAGRHCAKLALERLFPGVDPSPLGILPDRSPAWPEGVVGSITHCKGFAAAVVGHGRDFLGVGRDTESLVTPEVAGEIRDLVALGGEIETLELALGWDPFAVTTLVFSAKESLFKCLYPVVKIFFEFSDARLEKVTADGAYDIQLLRDLGRFSAGSRFTGSYVREPSRLHTLCVLTNGALSPNKTTSR